MRNAAQTAIRVEQAECNDTALYQAVFAHIKTLVPDFCPTHAMADFEDASGQCTNWGPMNKGSIVVAVLQRFVRMNRDINHLLYFFYFYIMTDKLQLSITY